MTPSDNSMIIGEIKGAFQEFQKHTDRRFIEIKILMDQQTKELKDEIASNSMISDEALREARIAQDTADAAHKAANESLAYSKGIVAKAAWAGASWSASIGAIFTVFSYFPKFFQSMFP